MKKSKITKEKIISLIVEEASVIKRKKEIYEEVIKLNKEIKKLNENQGLAGTFGFKNDKSNVTGFESTPNISHIAQLEKELGLEQGAEMGNEEPLSEDGLNEITALRAENETLKERLQSIEDTLKTFVSTKKEK